MNSAMPAIVDARRAAPYLGCLETVLNSSFPDAAAGCLVHLWVMDSAGAQLRHWSTQLPSRPKLPVAPGARQARCAAGRDAGERGRERPPLSTTHSDPPH